MVGEEGRRIGVLTGGGDCPGLNAVIRAVVKTACRGFSCDVVGIEDGFEGLIDPLRLRPLGPDEVRGVLPRGGTILGTTNRGNPFAYQVRENGQLKTVDISPVVVENVSRLRLNTLVVIGGEGSLFIANQLQQRGVPIVGVPKTIDNDLSATDLTFGFDTAMATATEALDKLHTTAESHHRVMVLEVMGRNTGWIALQSGLAGGADVILIPEIPYSLTAIARAIEDRDRAGRKFSIVVVAEGAAPMGGEQVYLPQARAEGLPRLGGVGQIVAEALADRTGRETRVTVLGHLQRGGAPTPFDRLLATRFGAAAARLASEGVQGRMVALRGPDIVDVPLAEAVSVLKTVPPDGELVRTARGLDILVSNA
ncbi:MAG: 6-phosphofructokinase [Chloroflexota bacterium]